MSSINDFSLISGISNISRISKVNSSTCYRLDSTCNFSEWRSQDVTKSFITDNQRMDPKKLSESAKVNKALSASEESTCDYAKLEFMYDCLEEIVNSENNVIEADTKKKLKELITTHNIKRYLHLPNNSKDNKEELTLLGIIDLPQHEFSYEEQIAIKSFLETRIREKIYSFLSVYKNLGGSLKDVVKNNESMIRSRFQHKSELENLDLKNKIDEICTEYKRGVHHCIKMLSELKELQNKLHEKSLKDAESLLLRSEIAEIKAAITKLSCTIRMFKETPSTVDAFKILKNTLDEKIERVTNEIIEKTELEKAYNALSGTDYDSILKEYLEITRDIKKKRVILENL